MRPIIKTLKEAKAQRYGWGMSERGYREGHCVKRVWPQGRAPVSYQCQRKNGYGPAKLYCRQHDPAAVERRRQAKYDNREREQRLGDIARDISSVRRTMELLSRNRTVREACREKLRELNNKRMAIVEGK